MHAIRRISGGSSVVFVGMGLWACAASPPAVDDVFGDGCPDGCPGETTGAADGDDDPGADEGDTGDEPSASSDADRPDDDPKPPSGGEEGGDADIPDGDDSDGGSSTCCEAENATCLAGSDSASVCSALDTICTSGACEDLVTVCDPTTVPVSTAC